MTKGIVCIIGAFMALLLDEFIRVQSLQVSLLTFDNPRFEWGYVICRWTMVIIASAITGRLLRHLTVEKLSRAELTVIGDILIYVSVPSAVEFNYLAWFYAHDTETYTFCLWLVVFLIASEIIHRQEGQVANSELKEHLLV